MVNVKQFVSAKYLSAKNDSELKGKICTIDAAFPDTVNGEEKLIIRLSGIEKPLVLNQTNLSILIGEWGEDTDNWINHKVSIQIVKVQYNGSLVDGIQLLPIKK